MKPFLPVAQLNFDLAPSFRLHVAPITSSNNKPPGLTPPCCRHMGGGSTSFKLSQLEKPVILKLKTPHNRLTYCTLRIHLD